MSENKEQKRCPLRLIAGCVLPSAEGTISEACIEDRCAWFRYGICAITDIATSLDVIAEAQS